MQSALQQAQAQQTLQQKLQQAKAQGATDEQIRQMQAEADASRAGRAKRFGIMAMLLGLMTVLFPLGTVGMFVLMATMSVGYIAPERLPVIWHDWVLPWAPAHFVVDGVRSIVFLGDGVFNANALWVAVCVVIGVIVAAVGIALPARKKAGDDKVAQGDVVATAATTTNATHSIITTTLQRVETTHLRSEPAAAARHPLHRRLRPIRQSGRAILHLRRLHLRPIRLLPQRTRTRCHDPRPAAGQRLQRRQRHRRREQVAVRQRPGMTHPITKNRTKRKRHVPIRPGTRIPRKTRRRPDSRARHRARVRAFPCDPLHRHGHAVHRPVRFSDDRGADMVRGEPCAGTVRRAAGARRGLPHGRVERVRAARARARHREAMGER